jgi:hypothetical protein
VSLAEAQRSHGEDTLRAGDGSADTSPMTAVNASTDMKARSAAGTRVGWFSTQRAAVMGLMGMLFMIGLGPAVDPDLPWHLATGRWIVAHQVVPKGDPFSWSANGRKWIAHEWLAEIALYGGWKLGGWTLLIVSSAAIITLAWYLVYRTLRVVGAGFASSIVITFLAAIATVHTWGVRPQMLSLCFVAFVGLRLQQWRTSNTSRTPWELIALIALWANMHGGYIFGITMVLVFACGALGEQVLSTWTWVRGGRERSSWTRVGRIWALLAGCIAAALATPNTIDGLIYPFTYLGDNASTRYVGEWFAPDFSRLQYWPFALFGIALLVLIVLARRHVSLTDIGLTIPFLFMGVQSARNISQATVCGAPLLALLWTRRRDNSAKATRRQARTSTRPNQVTATQKGIISTVLSVTLVSALGVSAVASTTPKATQTGQAEIQPVIATAWLVKHPGGKLLNHYNFGGWLIWNRVPVFVDGRPDMYGDTFIDQYVQLTAARGNWSAELDRLGIDRVLLPAENQLAKKLAKDPRWVRGLADPVAVLFLRR